MDLTEESGREVRGSQPVEVAASDTDEVCALVNQQQAEATPRLLEVEEIDRSLYEVEELELYEKS